MMNISLIISYLILTDEEYLFQAVLNVEEA